MTLFDFLLHEISNECEKSYFFVEKIIRFFTAFRMDKKRRSEWTEKEVLNR